MRQGRVAVLVVGSMPQPVQRRVRNTRDLAEPLRFVRPTRGRTNGARPRSR